MKRTKWFAALGMALCAATATAGAASASTAHVASPAKSARPAYLQCSTYISGPNGYADCHGTDRWRLAVYCDWPSVSPVYSNYVYGTGSAGASCWFGRNAQYAAIEVG